MTRPVFLAALAVSLAVPAQAQDRPARSLSLAAEAPRGAEMAPASRLFEIHDGKLWLDGRALPDSAIPDGVDLSGVMMQLELVGPVTAVVEADGVLFVLEDERLVPFSASSKAGNPVYILGRTVVAPEAAPADRLEPVVKEAYRRQLSAGDHALYAKMQREAELEAEILTLARRARGTAPDTAYNALADDLKNRLRALFRLKQEIRREELDRAEDELGALRATLSEREAMREEIVTHRFHELMGTAPLDR